MSVSYTTQQRSIIEWVPEGTGHAVVIARAGTGKTWTALQAVRLMAPPSDRTVSVTMAMFNADIAAETRGKLAADGLRAYATTFHAAGWSAMLRAFPKIKLSGTGPKQYGAHKWDLIIEKLDIPKTYQSFAHKAMSMAAQARAAKPRQPTERISACARPNRRSADMGSSPMTSGVKSFSISARTCLMPCATTIPNSARCARNAFASIVCCRIRSARVR